MVRFLGSRTDYEYGLEDTETGEMIVLIEYDENGNQTINHDGIRKVHDLLNHLDFELDFHKQVIETFKQK